MGSYGSKGQMDDLLSQMKETDSQLGLLTQQIKRHEDTGDAWNDDENLNYFHMLEQQDELKKKKKKQEEDYNAAVETAERETARAQARLNNPVNLTDDEISANQALLQNLSQGSSIAKYQNTIKSGVKPNEIDRVYDAINRTDTRSNPTISDDDLWANQTRLDSLAGQEDPPGVRTNEVDRVYDAIKKTDTIKNPLISDEDILANLNRLNALGGSWGKEDERKKKQKYFDIADIPNRSPDDIRRIMGGEMYDKYLAENGKTDTDLRSDYLDRYWELLGGQSGSMRRDAITQMLAQDILEWDAGRSMGEIGNNTVEKQTATGYNGSSDGQSSGKSDNYICDPMNWETEFRNNIERKIGWLSADLNEKSRTRMVNAIILAEAEALQQKYRAVYYGSNNLLSSIFSPGLHKTLVPLFTEYPTKETETKPIVEAAMNGLSTGFSAGLWSEASKGIYHEGAGELIDGIKITDGKVGGKIPVDEFKTIRQSSIKNPDADSMTLGKFTDDATSYTQRAGTNSSYFDLGSEWGSIKQKYGLNNNEMFDYFNKSALNDAISKGKTIRFAHNPLDYNGSFLADEWEFLKETLNLTDDNLAFYGGFWYVR